MARGWAATLVVALVASLGVVGAGATAATAPDPRGTALACPPEATARLPFTDVSGTFAEAIRCVAAYGVTRGRTPEPSRRTRR